MSEKLLASTIELRDRLRAFVGAVAEITDCGHDVDAIVRADEAIEAWNRRTPAPEGEAWDHAFRPKATVECPWSLASSYPPDYAKFVLSDSRYEVVALYASPVVPAPEGEAHADLLNAASALIPTNEGTNTE